MTQNDNEKQPIQSYKYYCKFCDYGTSKKSNINNHYSTAKHKRTTKDNGIDYKKIHMCEFCKKIYKDRICLWRHKKKCPQKNTNDNDNDKTEPKKEEMYTIDKELFLTMVQQNKEFKDLIIEQTKQIIELAKGKSITNNTINNNTTNKFNMNFFLNEQCKGALDIMDFVTSLKVHLTDLENTGKIGYVKGISDIFLRGLKELDIHKRPIHCSDLKREVMYVKDKDVWEKDAENKKIKRAILHIADKNFNQLQEWIKENPESKNIETKKHEQYMQILCKCTGGIDNSEDDLYYNKIISNLAKEVVIDK
jgi:hypothetical protein